MFVHTVIMVIEPHMKQGRQHKLISTIFLATSVTKKLDHNISQEAKTILQIISQNPDMTQKEIAEKLGWKINRVKYHVNRMRQQNIIKRVGTSHKGHWEVV